jgi:RecB family exonuclease
MPETAEAPIAAGKIEHLSYSSLNQYRMCPKQFFFRKIACVPEERKSSSLVFGGAIHRAAERLHEAKIEGRKLPTAKALMSEYDTAWKEEVDVGPDVVYPRADSAESLRATAGKILALYRDHFSKQRGEIIAIEHEAVVPLVPDAVPLKARIDLVAVEGDNLVVDDLKTSKSRYSPAKIAEALPQLIVYAAAVAKMVRELGLKRIKPRFTVLTKTVTPVVQIVEPTASQADVVRLKELVTETADAISKEVFPRREGWQCAHCPYAGTCLGRK